MTGMQPITAETSPPGKEKRLGSRWREADDRGMRASFPASRRRHLLASLAVGAGICLGLSACESSKGKQAAVQFAFSWEQTIKVLGFGAMSNLREVKKQSDGMEQERSW